MSDLLGLRDILNPANFDHFQQNGTFSTATGVIASMRFLFAEIGFCALNSRCHILQHSQRLGVSNRRLVTDVNCSGPAIGIISHGS